jgi:hypothetical protein
MAGQVFANQSFDRAMDRAAVRKNSKNQNKGKSINELDNDVKLLIISKLDPVSLNKLSQTCESWNHICGDSDSIIWKQTFEREIIARDILTWEADMDIDDKMSTKEKIIKLVNDVTLLKIGIGLIQIFTQRKERVVSNSLMDSNEDLNDSFIPSQKNYKLLSLKNYTNYIYSNLSPLERDVYYHGYVNHVLAKESFDSLLALPHILFTPLKILGVISYPIYNYCQKKLDANQILSNHSSSSSLLCLRFLLIDLTIQAKSLQSLCTYHLFAIMNIACLFVLFLDLIAALIVRINWITLSIITGFSPIWLKSGQNISSITKILIYPIQFIGVLLFLLLQIQLFLLPFTIWSGISNQFNNSYQLFTFINPLLACLFQIFWIPIMCSIEETSYIGMQNYITDSTPFWFVGKSFRALTVFIQCFFGVFVYVSFLCFAVIHEYLF